ncbi:hypothetical protein CROQUDRAFT_136699 [Cronartium quercuum f. sp. fusiforme G11]|uniref:AAA+ ATPase domain-containing protein n=1 Tax=Cronartium quercuum f. sp. fusiforme G11 TaxID=708437 RepID=A0A9P6NA19_9BASI|nr:hypothetical protein CROQUDRAFT_136699 [Cronartium quercuum f. sp. fusiforme G11]
MMRSNPPPPNQETSPSKSSDRVLRDDKVILSSSHINRITMTAVGTISSAEPAAHLVKSPSLPDVASTSSSAAAQALFGSVQRVSLMPITATTFEGRKIWLPRRQKIGRGSALDAGRDRLQELQKKSLNLLDEPIYRMLDRIRTEKRDKQTPQASVQAQDQGSSANSMNLWTDRYRPTKFIDLIGDERVFRNSMSWLKEWDQCVFKDRGAAAKRKAAKKRSAQAAFAASGAKGSTFNNPTPDPLGRPQEKVLLLCGAPGLGKTTMAHVLAHQAGYDIVEVNASDDRTTKVVTGRIKSALETRTLDTANRQGGGMTLKNNRPTCVIIDEIDGAAGGTEGGFVRALVKLITDGSTVKAYKAKSQKAVTKPLIRPIICICNDLYATALRPLRPIARIIRFNTPTPMTLIKRLKTICDAEKLKTDIRNLTFLVRMASGDLRSCLNTLQLVQSQTNVVSETAIKSAAMVGMKDIGASVQSILSKVFKLPKKAKEGETVHLPPFPIHDIEGNRLSEFIQDADGCGEFKRIMQGCFESYLSAKHPTDLWGTYNLIHDWLHFYDQIDLKMQSEQIYGLTGYLPYTIAAWRELLGRITNIAPDYPKIDYEMFQKQVAYKEVADSFKQTMPPLMRVSFLTDVVITELIPLLMRIVSPDLRPVNSQLIRREERDVMMRVVTIMIELGLSFKLDKAEDGQSTFVLDPPIDLFTQFDGKRPQDLPPPRFGVRQMIARESNEMLHRKYHDLTILSHIHRKPVTTADKKEEKVAVDFFGRLVTDTTLPSMDSQGVPIRKKATVLYRYHEWGSLLANDHDRPTCDSNTCFLTFTRASQMPLRDLSNLASFFNGDINQGPAYQWFAHFPANSSDKIQWLDATSIWSSF